MKKPFNKRLIAAMAAIVVIIAAMAAIYFAARPSAAQGAKTITVAVTHSDNTTKTFTCHTDEEYLGEVLLAEGLIGGDEESSGLYTIVDGESASWEEDQAYWALYEGEEYAQQGINDTPVVDGGSYTLVYTLG